MSKYYAVANVRGDSGETTLQQLVRVRVVTYDANSPVGYVPEEDIHLDFGKEVINYMYLPVEELVRYYAAIDREYQELAAYQWNIRGGVPVLNKKYMSETLAYESDGVRETAFNRRQNLTLLIDGVVHYLVRIWGYVRYAP